MKRFAISVCTIVKFSLVPASLLAADTDSTNVVEITPTLVNQLADEAHTNHPTLRAAEARIDAARANEKSIRKWEDPTLLFGVELAERDMRADDGDTVVGVEQKLPLFGKPQAAKRVAEAEIKVQKADADFQFQMLRREIAVAVFKLGLAERTFEISKQDLLWLEAMLDTTARQYELGSSSQLDVLRLQNERAKRTEQLTTDSYFVEIGRVELNRLLDRDLHAPWPVLKLPAIAPSISYSKKLADLAIRSEPKLKMMLQQIKQAEAVVDETKRRRAPDFMVGAEVRQFSESAEVRSGMLTVSFNFPWGNRKRYDADTQREQAKAAASKLDATAQDKIVRTEIHQLTVKIDAARRQAVRYQDEIVPRSEASLQVARTAWEVNRGLFRDLLDTRRLLLEAQTEQARAVAEQYQLLAELVLCCGLGDLEALFLLSEELNPAEKKP